MKFLSYCIVLLILFQKCEVKNSNDTMSGLKIDTLIYTAEFKLLVDNTLEKVYDTNQITKVEDAILLVKIYNSIVSYDLLSQESYSFFYKKFNEVYLEKISYVLNCNLSIGMGYYCEKYKLIIGGVKYPKSSYIVILELQK